MPALHNQRQERFARLLAKGIPPYRAYPQAGYRPHHYSPYRLRENAAVKRRVAELGRHAAMRTTVTIETLLTDLAEDRRLARELGQPAAAISATQLMAKLAGLLIDRKEAGSPGDFAALASVEDVIAKVRQELGPEAADIVGKLVASQDELEPADLEPTHDAPAEVQ